MFRLAVAALAALIATSAGAAPSRTEALLVPPTADDQIPLIVRTRDAAGVSAVVRELGGRVTYVFGNIDGLAATLPRERMSALLADPRVEDADRQRLVRRAVVPLSLPDLSGVPGVRRPRIEGEVAAVRDAVIRRLPPSALLGGGPASFFGYDVLTGAAQSWEATDMGEGVIVAVLDTGIYPAHPALDGSVIGGESLVPAEEEEAIDHDDDGVADGRTFDWNALENDGHGTFVSGVIAGHAEIVLPGDDALALSVAANSPESIEFDDDGFARIRFAGLAPGASLYGIKVFPFDGGAAPDARIAEAIDRLIERKESGTLDTDVINMSLSGPVLHDGWNALDQMVDAATRAGITVVSAAANEGPSLLSVGSPGSAFTGLAVGGVSDPIHTRTAFEFLFGAPPGFGALVYPHETPKMADVAARGPTADRRVKPDLVATAFFMYSSALFDIDGDGLNDTPVFGFGSGTSFSAPAVAGAAALVTAYGDRIGKFAEAPYVANALTRAAVPIAEFSDVSQHRQGHGFVNVSRALRLLDAGRVHDPAPDDPRERNVTDLDLGGGSASGVTPPLAAGESFDFLVDVPYGVTGLTVEFPEVTHGDGSQDGVPEAVVAAVHTAKRGGTGDYVFRRDGFFRPLVAGESVVVPYPEAGTMRVTVAGLITNYEDVSASVRVTTESLPIPVSWSETGRLERDEMTVHTVEVPEGLGALAVRLSWRHDWTRFPTYDLDMYIQGPDGILPAASVDSPELAWIESPTHGTWSFAVLDFGTVLESEPYELALSFVPAGSPAERAVEEVERPRLAAVGANPLRGSAELSFEVPAAERVTLQVFDVTGRLVRRLIDGEVAAGPHRSIWDGRRDGGELAAGGVYFLRLETAGGSSTRKVTVVR
ncbi:MAG: S8 family serine peptidase [Candidatus Eiseniibacteriota bacterium]